jgi:tRNA threonylcarbamoyl adenosine modification protein (Sua5/YciO/YrdC/YwlC family)
MVLRTVTSAARIAILAEAAALLKRGGVVVLPTDTVYGLAAHPGCPRAIERITAIKGRAEDKPIALLASGIAAIKSLGGSLSPAAKRLAQAFWPGALTLVVDCRGGREGVRVPDHAFARDLIAACGGLLRVTSANLAGQAPALTAQEALRDVGLLADLVIDGGPVSGGVASTVVQDGADTWTMLREGAIRADQLTRALADGPEVRGDGPILLFVCTGNTCRSPMAEVVMRARLTSQSIWRVASAGTMATPGLPASPRAHQAVAEWRLGLADHTSSLLTLGRIQAATLIVAMGRSHLDYAVELCPAARDKVFLLRRFGTPADGSDIDDPAGGSLRDYCDCRDAISGCLPGLARFLDDLA